MWEKLTLPKGVRPNLEGHDIMINVNHVISFHEANHHGEVVTEILTLAGVISVRESYSEVASKIIEKSYIVAKSLRRV